jgi:hypothetical protein
MGTLRLGCPRNSADTELRGIFWLLKWFLRNSGEIPRNSAEFRGISPELHRKSLPYSAECQNVTSVDTLVALFIFYFIDVLRESPNVCLWWCLVCPSRPWTPQGRTGRNRTPPAQTSPACGKALIALKGQCHKLDFFFGLNISISTFWVCADGFTSLSKAFHYSIPLLTFYLILWDYLIILKMLTDPLSEFLSLWLVDVL